MVLELSILTIMKKMEVDAAWDDVYAKFPEADYIEQF